MTSYRPILSVSVFLALLALGACSSDPDPGPADDVSIGRDVPALEVAPDLVVADTGTDAPGDPTDLDPDTGDTAEDADAGDLPLEDADSDVGDPDGSDLDTGDAADLEDSDLGDADPDLGDADVSADLRDTAADLDLGDAEVDLGDADVEPDADAEPDADPDVGEPCEGDLSCTPACETAAGRADYSGCSFWAVDLDNTLDADRTGPGEAATAVVLNNVGEGAATVELTDAAGTLIATETVLAGETVTIPLPRADRVGTRLDPAGFHVESDEPLLAYQFTPLERAGTSSSDATLLIPTAALDHDYRVLTWAGGGYDQRGFASVVATVDGTTVAIDVPAGIASGVDFTGEMRVLEERVIRGDGSGLITRTLQRGDVFHVQSTPFGDLSGARVTADQPIAVFGGNRCSTVPDRVPKCDHLEHAMLPLFNQGRTYVGPGAPPRDGIATWYRVVANFDGTTLEYTADGGGTVTLAAGEVFTISSPDPVLFESSAPVLVGMFLGGAGEGGGAGDPSFTILPPTEQFRRDYPVLTPGEFAQDHLTVIRRAVSVITLDGDPISGPVYAGPDGWEILHLPVEDGPHFLESTSGFAVIATGYDEEVSYAYAGGLGLDKLDGSEPEPLVVLCEGGELPGSPCDTGFLGVCAPGRLTCEPGEPPECSGVGVAVDEVCDGRDDDCDGITDPGCAGLALPPITPEGDRVWIVEGESVRFEVDASALPEGTPITWAVDSDDFVDLTSTVLDWAPRQFDDGARTVSARAEVDGRIVRVEWLVLVTDAPSNTPVIWGHVAMPDGRIVPGVTIEATGGPSRDFESLIDGRGYYALPVEPGTYGVQIDTVFGPRPSWFARGIVSLVEGVEVDRANVRRDIVLPVSRVFGDVAIEGGESLPGTEVHFNGSCFACSGTGTADADGNYETWVYNGTYNTTATPPAETGLPARLEDGISVVAELRYDVRFSPVFELRGVVLDQYDDPVEGVTLTFEGPGAEADVTSEAGGAISVLLPADSYRVTLDTVFHSRPPQIGRGMVTLIDTLVIDADTPEQTIRLPNAQVSGVVYAEDTGEPVPGTELHFNGSCFACSGSATAGPDGTYTLPLLHANYRVEVTPPEESGYVNFTNEGIDVSADRAYDVEVPGPVWVLSGTLVDPRGAPVAGVTIESRGTTEAESATDETGRFELRLLEGDYTLGIDTVFASRPPEFPRGIIDIWSGTVSSDRDEDLVAPISYVTGRVQDEAGDGVAGTSLQFNGGCFACGQSATTDELGEYAAQVFQSTYNVEVTPPDPLPPVTLRDIDLTAVDTVVNVEF